MPASIEEFNKAKCMYEPAPSRRAAPGVTVTVAAAAAASESSHAVVKRADRPGPEMHPRDVPSRTGAARPPVPALLPLIPANSGLKGGGGGSMGVTVGPGGRVPLRRGMRYAGQPLDAVSAYAREA